MILEHPLLLSAGFSSFHARLQGRVFVVGCVSCSPSVAVQVLYLSPGVSWVAYRARWVRSWAFLFAAPSSLRVSSRIRLVSTRKPKCFSCHCHLFSRLAACCVASSFIYPCFKSPIVHILLALFFAFPYPFYPKCNRHFRVGCVGLFPRHCGPGCERRLKRKLTCYHGNRSCV